VYLLTKETELLLASASELETKYDNACKVLFSNKEIIAPILKYVIPKFNNLSVKEIIACIDEVSNGKYVSENIQIQQDKAEQNSLTDHLITYDIHFRTLNPKLSSEKIKVQLHIDLEIQNEFYVGYPLVKRGIYYAARELSGQIPVVTTGTNFQCLEKIYSIWICNENVPQRLQNTVKSFRIKENNRIGDSSREPEQNYDMMEIVFIYRQDDEEKLEDNFGTEREQSVFDYLTSVFACDIDRLSSYIGGRIHEKIRKEVITMTGLGASIRKKSEAKGRAVGQSEGKRLGERTGTYKTYYMFMRDGKITLEEIADRLHITADEYMREMDKILEEDEVGSLL
jgi:hypothetical protein